MVGSHPPRTTDVTAVPFPRRPPDATTSGDDPVRRWYENELGWPTVPASTPGSPVRLRTGLRFDVLDLPLKAGPAALRHLADRSPVAVRGDRMRLLVAAGSTEELPGILEWLDWGSLPLDLRAMGTGDSMAAPVPSALGGGLRGPGGPTGAALGGVPVPGGSDEQSSGTGRLVAAALPGPGRGAEARPLVLGRQGALQGAAVWLRPPEPGCEVETSLPTMSALGGGGGAPDLVRVVDTVATQCHRLRLRRARP
ncbi:SCO3374 family protein [Streptomyces sp. NPDC019531]|uniref:SCO3374 family protein n=1 Tax=Streptomyces sp. NPDC019531 TaxID=3365062 RepID=UPI00384C562F